jgi:glycosyltransferase involved in cell wall biosynthesis
MHAGLAILTSDLDFVAQTVSDQRCGVTYRPSVEGSLRSAVETIAADMPALESMKANAYAFATSTFNWEAQARSYSAAIRRLARMDGLDS